MSIQNEISTLVDETATRLGVSVKELEDFEHKLSNLHYRGYVEAITNMAVSTSAGYSQPEELDRIRTKLTGGDAAFLVAAKEWLLAVPSAKAP